MVISEKECRKIAHDACMMGYNLGTSMLLRMVKELINPVIYEQIRYFVEEGEQFKDGQKVLDLIDSVQKKEIQ